MATTTTHCVMSMVDSSGNINIIYPRNTGSDVIITPNTTITSTTLQGMVDNFKTVVDGLISAKLPTVNNGTLTIQKNGTNVQTFTANQSTNVTANITVPTALSGLTDDATHRLVTDTEKSTWNGKADKSTNYGDANTYYVVLHNTSDNKDYYSLNNSNNNYISFEKSGNEYYEKIYSTGGEGGYSTLSSTALNFQPYRNDSVTYSYEGITIGNSTTLTKTKLSYLNNITSDVQTQINGKAASSHTHNYAGSSSAGGSANNAVYSNTINATYSGSGGQQGPSYFGKNRLGSLMSNQTINGDSAYKNWIYMDGYNGTDVGGASAIGVDRYYGSNTTPRAFIMTSDANRTSWNASAELITTANVSRYAGGGLYLHRITMYGFSNATLKLIGAHSTGNNYIQQTKTYGFGKFDTLDFSEGIYLVNTQSNMISSISQLATAVADNKYVRWDTGSAYNHNLYYEFTDLKQTTSNTYEFYGIANGYLNAEGGYWSNAICILTLTNIGSFYDTVTNL